MKLIAHGGYSSKYPENTLESFLEAQKFNPYAIEMDVVYDPIAKVLRCYHPSGVSSESGTFNSEEIHSQREVLSEFPAFEDVLKRLNSSQKILVDLKDPSDSNLKAVAEILRHDIERYILGARSYEDFLKIKEIDSNIVVLALFSNPDDYLSFANEGGEYFRLRGDDVIPERVANIHNLGLKIWVVPGKKSTPSSPRTSGDISEEELIALLDVGVDGVEVNDIEMATRVVNS